MSQTLMQQLIKYEGSCCIYGYFMKRKDMTPRELSDHLGVTPNTVRKWFRRIASGEISCGYGVSGLNGCLNHVIELPQETPPNAVAGRTRNVLTGDTTVNPPDKKPA